MRECLIFVILLFRYPDYSWWSYCFFNVLLMNSSVLQLSCHDASLAIRPVFDHFETVVITSGTLSPIDLYPRLLNFNPVISRSFTMSLTRDCICPMVLTRGRYELVPYELHISKFTVASGSINVSIANIFLGLKMLTLYCICMIPFYPWGSYDTYLKLLWQL